MLHCRFARRWRLSASLAAVLALTTTWFGSSFVANAQTLSCYPRAKVAQILRTRHGERWVALGMTNDGAWRYEFWSTADGTKWTLFVSRSQGVARLACILASGKDWKTVGRVWEQRP